MPAIVSSSVVFPDPAGPMTTPYAPLGTVNVTSASTNDPTRADSPRASITRLPARAGDVEPRTSVVPQRTERGQWEEREHGENRGDWQRLAEPEAREAIVAQHARGFRVVREDDDRAELAHRTRPHHHSRRNEASAGKRKRHATEHSPARI